jgi:hypothetical protein
MSARALLRTRLLPFQSHFPSHPRVYVSTTVQARRRSTQRATDEIPRRNSDSFGARRASFWRSQGPSAGHRRPREREPLDAELLILFGLPALVVLIAWFLNDGIEALAIVPLVLIVPGPRDVVLAVLRDTIVGLRRARNFMNPSQSSGQRRNTASPPPPPPPPMAAKAVSTWKVTMTIHYDAIRRGGWACIH